MSAQVKRTVEELAADYGWGVTQTGGGCSALEKERDHAAGSYCYITDEANAPRTIGTACLLSFFDGENSGPVLTLSCPDVEAAMKIAAMEVDL